MATHSRILAWRIPIDRGAWGLTSPWGRRVRRDQAHASSPALQSLFRWLFFSVEHLRAAAFSSLLSPSSFSTTLFSAGLSEMLVLCLPSSDSY